MYWINKVVWALANPTVIGFACVFWGLAFSHRCWGRRLLVISLIGVWIWTMPLTTRMLGLPLEREWLVEKRVPCVESFPVADAIVLLGGSMGGATNMSEYAEMSQCADRVWQAARLYIAGKAPRIFVTGKGNEFATKGLLADFGVPTNAMAFVDQARNTEEEARAIAQEVEVAIERSEIAEGLRLGLQRNYRILLVTSAWHMRRAKMMFEKYARGLDVVPAPTDYETTMHFAEGFSWFELLPSGQCMAANEYLFHEWLGYLGYKLFR